MYLLGPQKADQVPLSSPSVVLQNAKSTSRPFFSTAIHIHCHPPLGCDLPCTGGTCHSPKHLHPQALSTARHHMASLEVCYRLGSRGAVGAVAGDSKFPSSQFLELLVCGTVPVALSGPLQLKFNCRLGCQAWL